MWCSMIECHVGRTASLEQEIRLGTSHTESLENNRNKERDENI